MDIKEYNENIKLFSNFKTGYNAGIYGCNAEYYTLTLIEIIDNKLSVTSYNYNGIYTAGNFNMALKENGYREYYVPCVWGKVTRNDTKYMDILSAYKLAEILKDKHNIPHVIV